MPCSIYMMILRNIYATLFFYLAMEKRVAIKFFGHFSYRLLYTINVKKTYQFKVSVKDDNYDACKTANIKIHLSVGPPPVNRFQLFLAHRVTTPNDLINRGKFHLDRLRGFGWAGD
jgi:hypothetical protein